LPAAERTRLLAAAKQSLMSAGADVVIDSVADLISVIDG
jgi:phosphoglycolate phosphatase-like HAD superfamily hydrolase